MGPRSTPCEHGLAPLHEMASQGTCLIRPRLADSIVPIRELEPKIFKTPRLRSICDLNLDMEVSGTQLTEQALLTLPAEEPGTASGKGQFSVMSDEDDDDATFDA